MTTTTLIGTPDPEPDDTGRVLEFRKPTTGPAGESEVIEAEIVDDEEESSPGRTAVQVDPPGPVADTSLEARMRAPATRRPVIVPWLRSRAAFTETARWAAGQVGHIAAFHAVRLPLYAIRLALRAPRGLLRAIAVVVTWAFDLEGAPLRHSAVVKDDPATYLKLAQERSDRVRGRVWLTVLGLVVLAGTGLAVWTWGAWWARCLVFGGWIGLAGWFGTPADKRIAGRAVVTTKAPKLTSDVVVRALSSLGIAQINQAVAKGGDGITFPAPIQRDGPGWRAEVDLPFGVVVTDIMERRDKLASGLRRPLGCVWPEPVTEQHAGRLVIWVGDQDMSQAKPKPWPLAKSGRADIFTALPFGTDQRGRLVSILLMFANLLIGAMPRQGKTFALRIVLLAAALDPTVQLRIFELKGTGDLSGPGEKCAHHYGTGADDDTLKACIASLREVKAELDSRAKTIRELPREVCPENKVTPELARRKGLGLHPIVFAIDECQELFSHPDLGKEAEELCVPIIKRGPALGIMLVLATQRPDAKSLPTGVADNMGIRFCLRVMGWQANDMVLGTGAHQNGIRATLFGPKDKGIGMLVGATDDPQIVRSGYVDGPAAETIAERARALRIAAGTLTGYAAGQAMSLDIDGTEAGVSLLTDVIEAWPVGVDKVWSETVVDRLAELRPETYGPWAAQDGKTKATQLAAALKPYGITTGQVWATGPDGKTGNRRGIARADVLTAFQKLNGG